MSVMSNGKPDRKGPRFEKQIDELTGVLSDGERAELREKARLLVLNEQKKREEEALLAAYIKEERQQTIPDEQLVPIWLTLAPIQGEFIMLDNKQYFNEFGPYYVTPAVFASLAEIQSRGWAHEDQTDVRDVIHKRRIVRNRPSHVGGANFMDNRSPRDLRVSSGQLAGSSPEALLGIR